MNTDAIVYTSNTGYTAEYAKIIAKRTGLLVYSFDEARKNLPKKSRIIYLGWLMAGKIPLNAGSNKTFLASSDGVSSPQDISVLSV